MKRPPFKHLTASIGAMTRSPISPYFVISIHCNSLSSSSEGGVYCIRPRLRNPSCLGVKTKVDTLTPPPGTRFWYRQAVQPRCQKYFSSLVDLEKKQPYRVRTETLWFWYATNANPTEPNFPENNGVVYAVFLITGTSHFEPTYFIQMSSRRSMICERQYPEKEEKIGEDYFCAYIYFFLSRKSQ